MSLTEKQKKELDRRIVAYHHSPSLGSPWKKVKKRTREISDSLLFKMADKAMREAVRGVIAERKLRGQPLIIWHGRQGRENTGQ